MRYFKAQVAVGHLGTKRTEYQVWYIATNGTAPDVLVNTGHQLAGVKRVTEVSEIDVDDYKQAHAQGEKCVRL